MFTVLVLNINCVKSVLEYHRTIVECKKDEKPILDGKIGVLEKKIVEAEEAKKDEEEKEEGALEWGLFVVKFVLEAGLASCSP
ncbi:hypothetical protein M0R45_031819 [Rubus argutus]|uniref:Uncharacterized protein n=1 Tax=Rubus argutus TaxID=59490 RepID=A0AAW1WFR3_RUBAR